MCLVYLGNIFDVVIIIKKLLNWCSDNLMNQYSCNTIKLLQENMFFVSIFTLSKFFNNFIYKNSMYCMYILTKHQLQFRLYKYSVDSVTNAKYN